MEFYLFEELQSLVSRFKNNPELLSQKSSVQQVQQILPKLYVNLLKTVKDLSSPKTNDYTANKNISELLELDILQNDSGNLVLSDLARKVLIKIDL